MTEIERARALLRDSSAAVVNGEREITLSSRGVGGLLNLLESGDILRGASVADKVVGKAAALIMVKGGVKEVYAKLISGGARAVFEKYGVKYTCGRETDVIVNRDGTGQCPMEQTVRYIDGPDEAVAAVKRTLRVLSARANGGKIMKKLGMGMMRLPLRSEDRTDVDLELVKKIVDTFMERGFEYFDTAYLYHEYTSELVVKECLVKRYPRESFKLATKLPTFSLEKAEDMPRIFNEQLEKCGVEYFDYYLLHNINSGDYGTACKLDAFGFVRKLKEQGKVKHYGFSFHDTPELLEEILTAHPDVDFVQLQINYLDWDSHGVQSEKCWEVARKHGKPVIVMEPLKGGTLVNLPEEAAALLKAHRPDMSIPSWALRFAAGLDGVFMVLSGMNGLEQVEDNTKTIDDFRPLDEGELQTLKKATAAIKSTGAIACTVCRYCTENCPAVIPIPDYFSLYNLDVIENRKGWTTQLNYYENYTRSHGKASDCIKCGACESHCPQHLPIRDLLVKVAEKFEK